MLKEKLHLQSVSSKPVLTVNELPSKSDEKESTKSKNKSQASASESKKVEKKENVEKLAEKAAKNKTTSKTKSKDLSSASSSSDSSSDSDSSDSSDSSSASDSSSYSSSNSASSSISPKRKQQTSVKKAKVKRVKEKSSSRTPSPKPKRVIKSPSPKPSKINVARLTRNINEAHIKEIFGAYGEIKNVDLPLSGRGLFNKGYASIEYASTESADKAKRFMDGGQIDGQEIMVAFILPRRMEKKPEDLGNRERSSKSPTKLRHNKLKEPSSIYSKTTARKRSKSRSPRRRSPSRSPKRHSGGRSPRKFDRRRSRSRSHRRSPIKHRSDVNSRSKVEASAPKLRRNRSKSS